jgi:hypothetical protein
LPRRVLHGISATNSRLLLAQKRHRPEQPALSRLPPTPEEMRLRGTTSCGPRHTHEEGSPAAEHPGRRGRLLRQPHGFGQPHPSRCPPRADPATNRPDSGRNSEHAAGYPGPPARLVLLLLHDLPDPGRSHRFPCSSPPSDTLNPHELPFAGMLDCHPCSASGGGGCSLPLSLGGRLFLALA